jgi:hypothetical protein
MGLNRPVWSRCLTLFLLADRLEMQIDIGFDSSSRRRGLQHCGPKTLSLLTRHMLSVRLLALLHTREVH